MDPAQGRQEEGETVAETALREVREETGLEAELIGPLDTIDYWFVWAPSGPGTTSSSTTS